VLDAAGVYPVRRDEHLQEMGIQFFGRARSEPAKACQLGVPFQVDSPVGARVALRREQPEKVIHYRLVFFISLGESARAPLSGHADCLSARHRLGERSGAAGRSGEGTVFSVVPAAPA
jgi:hypothetical protein